MYYEIEHLKQGERSFVQRCQNFADTVIKDLHMKYDHENVFAEEIHKLAFENNILNGAIPKQYGGQGLSHLALIHGGIALSEVCTPTSFSLGFNHGTMRPILQYGTQQQKNTIITEFVNERKYISWGMTEPDTSGSNLFDIKTTAIKQGDSWMLNGEKCMLGNGTAASLYLVLARTIIDDDFKGLSVFLVPRDSTIIVSENTDKLGFRCVPTPSVKFINTTIPSENYLHAIGDGTRVLLDSLDFIRFGGGIVLYGLSSATIKETTDFAFERNVLGGRLSDKSHVQINLGHFLAELESLKILLFDIGRRIDMGVDFGQQSSALKLLGSDLAQRVTSEAVQIWGWRGIDADYPIQKRFRDARQTTIYEGTNQLLAMKLFKDMSISRRQHEKQKA